MEYLVAALALLLAVSYGVLIAVNIEKGKSWALETAQAISMLDPHHANFELRARVMGATPDAPPSESVATETDAPEDVPQPEEIDRQAA